MTAQPEKFDYFYSKLAVQVFVSETIDGKFEVVIDNPHGPRWKPFASKVFKRGADPSQWIGQQLAKVMPKFVTDLHKERNDDWKNKPEPAVGYTDRDYWGDLDSYGYEYEEYASW